MHTNHTVHQIKNKNNRVIKSKTWFISSKINMYMTIHVKRIRLITSKSQNTYTHNSCEMHKNIQS